jgi:hypothetical protein
MLKTTQSRTEFAMNSGPMASPQHMEGAAPDPGPSKADDEMLQSSMDQSDAFVSSGEEQEEEDSDAFDADGPVGGLAAGSRGAHGASQSSLGRIRLSSSKNRAGTPLVLGHDASHSVPRVMISGLDPNTSTTDPLETSDDAFSEPQTNISSQISPGVAEGSEWGG